ncbi:MAG: polyprenyl synthetase family protein [Hyphomicrobiales bacterium]
MPSLGENVPELLARYREPLESALRGAVGEPATDLARAAHYVMGWQDAEGRPTDQGGKRIRPALCLLAAELFGGDIEAAMPGAVAVELVHNFSLVHDEVQDHDAERHHRPTLWARIGEGQAINAGDYLYTRAIAALANGQGDPALRMEALRVLNRAIDAMIQGQWQDIAFESRVDVGVAEYLEMVAGKTGALLGAPLEIGALLAGAGAERAALIGRWGVQVGLAFQAQDDYLGTWGDPAATGKSNSSDIARRKKSLPVVFGLADGRARETIVSAYTLPGDELDAERIRGVVAALEQAGAGRATRERAAEYAEAADALLEALHLPDEDRASLNAVARYLVNREA